MSEHLYRTRDGRAISIGFDMMNRRFNPQVICWDDGAGEWDYVTHPNISAGRMLIPDRYGLCPQFVGESFDGKVLIYQPGLMVEMQLIGPPLVYSFQFYEAGSWAPTRPI